MSNLKLCLSCGKPLTEKSSRAAGMGPVCRAESYAMARQSHAKMDDLFSSPRADFDVTKIKRYLLIEDKVKGNATVEQDIDHVLDACFKTHSISSCSGVLILSHSGVIDAVEIDNLGKFVAFIPLSALSVDSAIQAASAISLKQTGEHSGYLSMP